MSEATVPRRRAVRGHQGIYFRPTSIDDFEAKPPYEFKYKNSNGKWVGPIVATLSDGATPCATLNEVKECKARHVVAGARGLLVKRTNATLGEYIDRYIAKPRRKPLTPSTTAGYRRSKNLIPPVILKRKIADVRVTDMEDRLAELSQPRGAKRRVYADQTLHVVLTLISGAFSLAMRSGDCGANPVKAIDKDVKPRPNHGRASLDGILKPDEIRKLVTAKMPEWLRVIIWLAIFSGLRQSELLGLSWGCIDFEAGVVQVRGQWTREGCYSADLKSGASRRDVRIDAATVKMLREWWMRCGRPGADCFVFASNQEARQGIPFVQMTVWESFKVALETAGIRTRRFHDLRHTFASILIANGCSVKWVQVQMGHSTPSITLDTYTSLWNLEADQARHDEAMEKAQRAAGL